MSSGRIIGSAENVGIPGALKALVHLAVSPRLLYVEDDYVLNGPIARLDDLPPADVVLLRCTPSLGADCERGPGGGFSLGACRMSENDFRDNAMTGDMGNLDPLQFNSSEVRKGFAPMFLTANQAAVNCPERVRALPGAHDCAPNSLCYPSSVGGWFNHPWLANATLVRELIVPHLPDCSRAADRAVCNYVGIELNSALQTSFRSADLIVAQSVGIFTHLSAGTAVGSDCLEPLANQFVFVNGEVDYKPRCVFRDKLPRAM